MTSAYVTGNFIGGAIGSAAGSLAWEAGGWSAVCALGGAIALVAFGFWLSERGLWAARGSATSGYDPVHGT